MTAYLVLLVKDGCYREAAALYAKSANAAIRKAVEDSGEGGVYVAVPARSFKPVEVALEQQVTVKLGPFEPGEDE